MKNDVPKEIKSPKKLLKIPLYIILLPYYIILGIGKLLAYMFKGVKFSMKRRITLNYLGLYIISGLITFAFMLIGFTLFEISRKSDEIYLEVDSLIDRYEMGIYQDQDLQKQINSLAEIRNCGIVLEFSDKEIKSERFMTNYPEGFFDRVKLIFTKKLYVDSKQMYLTEPANGNLERMDIKFLHPIEPFYKRIETLALMLFISFVFGFVFIGFFGTLISGRILRPIFVMTRTAEKISINNLDQELDVHGAKYELRDLAITLNEMLKRLRKDYEKQKRFVSDVSHELRTPISIINGYSSMLKRWGKQDESILEESIEAIIGESKNMQVLVENLLTLVRADNQTLKFKQEDFFMNELIEEIASESQMINQKNQTIRCDCPQTVQVHLDLQMTKQMIRIFVDNAVKYSPEGGLVEIDCREEEGNCVLRVRDYGIGIDSTDLPYIFDRFYRSDESRTRETGGHGLGLSIAKAIVLGQGGKIKVKSKKGEGSEFTIILPGVG